MTTILAIDSATGPCSVAVWDGARVVAYVENIKPIMQSASLIPMVEDALKQAGMGYKDIMQVASTTGPGSFTGIRVALASAKGIAYASKVPGIAYTTLDVLAYAARLNSADDTILAILQAGKGEWYYQYYGAISTGSALGTLEVILAQSGGNPVVFSGNAPIDTPGFTSCGVTFPRADALAMLAASGAAASDMRPFYIRAPDAKLPTKKL